MLNLVQVPAGKKVRLVKIIGGVTLRKRLEEMGIYPETEIEIIKSSGEGPIIVKVDDTRFGLGRGMAAKILVDMIQGGENYEKS